MEDKTILAMNAKQQRFVLEYIKDLNATQAAIRSGYSKKTAGQHASRLLKDVKVRDAIDKKASAIAEKQDISVEWVLEKLRKTSDTCEQPAVQVRATELIGKHLGMFREKVELDLGQSASNLVARLTKALERTG